MWRMADHDFRIERCLDLDMRRISRVEKVKKVEKIRSVYLSFKASNNCNIE